MPKILIVDKSGSIKSEGVKTFSEQDLYKKCNFKSGEGFAHHTTWDFVDVSKKILLYGKTTGRANYENKYDFPPPADNVLFFGSCVLVLQDLDGNVLDLTPEFWQERYNILFGGFEDLSGREEESDDETQNFSAEEKTNTGYVKDDFVVEDEDDAPPQPAPRPPSKKRKVAKTAAEISAEVQNALEPAAVAAPTPTLKKRAAAASRSQKKPTETQQPIIEAPTPAPPAEDVPPEKSIYEESPELVEEDYLV